MYFIWKGRPGQRRVVWRWKESSASLCVSERERERASEEMIDGGIFTSWVWDKKGPRRVALPWRCKDTGVTGSWISTDGFQRLQDGGSKVICCKGGDGGESLHLFLAEKGHGEDCQREQIKVCWLQIYYGYKLFSPPSPLYFPNLSLFQKTTSGCQILILAPIYQILDFSPTNILRWQN